jgi:chromosome segregation ATPase
MSQLERNSRQDTITSIKEQSREDVAELERRLTMLELRLKEKDSQIKIEKMKSNRLEQSLVNSEMMFDKRLNGFSNQSKKQEQIKNRISNTKSSLYNIQQEIADTYKKSLTQIESIIDKKRGLKNDLSKHQEFENYLIGQLQTMVQKLLEIETNFRENEMHVHETLQIIQEEIKSMYVDFEATREKYTTQINQKTKDFDRLNFEYNKLMVISSKI